MKNIGKIVLAGTAGLAGYFIGFYEMKYKTLKALTEIIVEKKENKTSKEGDGKERVLTRTLSFFAIFT